MNRLTILAFFLSAHMSPIFIHSMDQYDLTIKTTTHSMSITVDANATILNIKNELYRTEGIPQSRQHLFALEPNMWKLCLVSIRSEKLVDDANVKDIVTVYNTKTLCLMLSNQQAIANPPYHQ